MAKKIERSRIDAGRFELPTKLAFLATEKLDYVSITDKDGVWTIEVPAVALIKLSKARADLKQSKLEHKKQLADQVAGLDAERAAHQATRDELAKLQRRTKALEKKIALAGSAPPDAVITGADVAARSPGKTRRTVAARKAAKA